MWAQEGGGCTRASLMERRRPMAKSPSSQRHAGCRSASRFCGSCFDASMACRPDAFPPAGWQGLFSVTLQVPHDVASGYRLPGQVRIDTLALIRSVNCSPQR